MKKILLLTFIILFPCLSYEQKDSSKFSIGLYAGIGQPDYNKYYLSSGFHADVTANYEFSKHSNWVLYLGETINPFDAKRFMTVYPWNIKVTGGTYIIVNIF